MYLVNNRGISGKNGKHTDKLARKLAINILEILLDKTQIKYCDPSILWRAKVGRDSPLFSECFP